MVNDASLAVHAATGDVDAWVLGDLEDEGQRALARTIARGAATPGASPPGASAPGHSPRGVAQINGEGPRSAVFTAPAVPASSSTTVAVVAHHGSAKQFDGLASLLAPNVAAFSAGADNGYGHPAREALAMYAQVGAVIVRTDEDGHLAIRTDGVVRTSS